MSKTGNKGKPEPQKPWWVDTEYAIYLERKLGERNERYRRQLQLDQNFARAMAEISGDIARLEGICPCGKHKGIRFYNRVDGQDKPVSMILCPNVIFTRKLRAAIRNGNGREFAKTYSAFAKQYVIAV